MHTVLGREVWNGDYPWERVADMQRRAAEAEAAIAVAAAKAR